jgi:hypothetical protein
MNHVSNEKDLKSNMDFYIVESVNEGKKVFKVNPGIGKAKYSISSHDGKKTHKDGSDFYDIEIFNNKVDLEKGIKKYTSNGFMKESVNEANDKLMKVGSTMTLGGNNLLKPVKMKLVSIDYLPKDGKYSYKFQGGGRTQYYTDDVLAKKLKESVNEVASRTAMEIGALTGTNKDFIQNFVDKNELDIEKVFQYVKKGKFKDRMDFVTAVAGKPNNPFQVKLIKQFKK